MNEDDIRENIVLYDDEGGEEQCADTQIGYQTVPSARGGKKDRRTEETSQLFATLSKKLNSSDDNFMGAPWDSRLLYKYEGSNSVLNSLSSLNSNLTDRSLDLRVSSYTKRLYRIIDFVSYKLIPVNFLTFQLCGIF